jgi:hypothetical protein
VPEVGPVLLAHALEVGDQLRLDRGWQHGQPILVPLAVADGDLVHREVDVLHAQTTAFQQAQPGAVEQNRHEPRHAVEPLEDGADLVARQHDGQMLGPLGPDDVVEPREVDAEHLAIQKEQGAQGLVLGGGGDLALHGEGRQERGDFGGAHLGRVALAVEEDVALDPVDVRLLGAAAVVADADGLAHAVEKSWLRQVGWTGFTDSRRCREGACCQDGIGVNRPMSDYGHAGNAPFCSWVSNIAERVGTRKTNPRSIAKTR